MKKLKNEGRVTFEDMKEVQCGVCNARMWDKGDTIVKDAKVVCSNCGAGYSFEPIAWKVFLN